jgi:hypothetical protein
VSNEVPQSYLNLGNPELDQTRYIAKTQEHGFMDLEVARLLSGVCAFCEKKRHAIMDYSLVLFHIRACIARHVELQNVAGTLMDQS